MTSKEAFEHIIFDAKMEKPIFSMYYQEFLKPIEKDLEVLEILKKYSYSNDNTTLFIALDCMNFNELEIVKEWLEDDN